MLNDVAKSIILFKSRHNITWFYMLVILTFLLHLSSHFVHSMKRVFIKKKKKILTTYTAKQLYDKLFKSVKRPNNNGKLKFLSEASFLKCFWNGGLNSNVLLKSLFIYFLMFSITRSSLILMQVFFSKKLFWNDSFKVITT